MITEGGILKKTNKLTLREEVYNLLFERPYSNEQIADSLGQPLSSICARINELKKINLVIDSGKRTKSVFLKASRKIFSFSKSLA